MAGGSCPQARRCKPTSAVNAVTALPIRHYQRKTLRGVYLADVGIYVGSQLCAKLEAKNLATAETTKTARVIYRMSKEKSYSTAGGSKKTAKATQQSRDRVKLLQVLTKRGGNLYDPERIKETVAKQAWSNGRKNNAVDAYRSYLKMVGGNWQAPLFLNAYANYPSYQKKPKSTSSSQVATQRMATFLQMLKETGARCGEIWPLKWDDVDFESKVVNITAEKHSNPRVVHLTNKLLEMLQALPKEIRRQNLLFPSHASRPLRNPCLAMKRERLVHKLKNPRLRKIHFHTFRYWKGTVLYHQTKDMYYVMQRLWPQKHQEHATLRPT